MMSRCTAFLCSLITGVLLGAIALVATPAAPAFAVTGVPSLVLYVFPGVTDNGGTVNTGVATAVHCYNFSNNAETIQFLVRTSNGTTVTNFTFNAQPGRTITALTHSAALYGVDVLLNTGVVEQGLLGIVATSFNMVCTAQVIDASATVPNGIDLHGMRLNPPGGTQE